MSNRPLHGSFLQISVALPVRVLPIVTVHLLRRQLIEEAVALLLAFEGLEIIRIAEKILDMDLLIRIIYILGGGDGTAYFGHPVHPPLEVFGPDAADHVRLLLRPPSGDLHLHPRRRAHMNHQ